MTRPFYCIVTTHFHVELVFGFLKWCHVCLNPSGHLRQLWQARIVRKATKRWEPRSLTTNSRGKNVRLPTVNKLFGQRTNLSIEVKKVAPASSWKTCCIYIAGSYSFFMLFVCLLFSGHHILCIEIFMYHLYMPIRVVHSPIVQFCLAAFLTNLTQMSNKTWHRWTFFNST